ncbi:hypothetical protein [Gracilibacillus thailandensis]|uniref:Uncharacterized protein n=1 Tax=Gracilibacillus thailandensis TaxID=563735 RepID=A0A6N7QWP0_9BACI|nr:hypothetical protein [Gracilibacillus thailandensis]MRI65140.1 hypothetical protein [Gracilibacillus thailandensis]
MTATSHLRGHPIEHNGKEWVYSDTKESTVETHTERACGYCGEHATPEGHDACLGTLPGVMNACCGHGHDNDAYVQFNDKSIARGKEAIKFMNKLRE